MNSTNAGMNDSVGEGAGSAATTAVPAPAADFFDLRFFFGEGAAGFFLVAGGGDLFPFLPLPLSSATGIGLGAATPSDADNEATPPEAISVT